MASGIGRRRFLGLLAGLASLGVASRRARAGDVTAMDNCYWRREQGPTCFGGTLQERWCWRCCDIVSGCTVIRCEWRVVGTC